MPHASDGSDYALSALVKVHLYKVPLKDLRTYRLGPPVIGEGLLPDTRVLSVFGLRQF